MKASKPNPAVMTMTMTMPEEPVSSISGSSENPSDQFHSSINPSDFLSRKFETSCPHLLRFLSPCRSTLAPLLNSPACCDADADAAPPSSDRSIGLLLNLVIINRVLVASVNAVINSADKALSDSPQAPRHSSENQLGDERDDSSSGEEDDDSEDDGETNTKDCSSERFRLQQLCLFSQQNSLREPCWLLNVRDGIASISNHCNDRNSRSPGTTPTKRRDSFGKIVSTIDIICKVLMDSLQYLQLQSSLPVSGKAPRNSVDKSFKCLDNSICLRIWLCLTILEAACFRNPENQVSHLCQYIHGVYFFIC